MTKKLNRMRFLAHQTAITSAIFFIVAICVNLTGVAFGDTRTFTIEAPSGIVVDANTGETLWSKNPDEIRAIASTTKIMTAILAIENKDLDETVTASKSVSSAGKYGIGLSEGEKLKLRDLIYALMLNSANDVALAIAEHVGGSVEEFIEMMNDRAKIIGMKNTNYTNPHGITNKEHHSTAKDLAIIAEYAIEDKIFADIVATKQKLLNRSDQRKLNLVENRNRLLWNYDGATGIKTGYTKESGYCLVASAHRYGVSLIAVILGADTQDGVFKQASTALDHGFSLYYKKKIAKKGDILKTVKLKYGQKVSLAANSDIEAFIRRSKPVTIKVIAKDNIRAPIKRGTVLGKAVIKQSGREVATAPLVAKASVEKLAFSEIVYFYIKSFLKIMLN